ncbi:MAG: rod shape-determining protein MreC [Chloroflexota bacterium]
MTPILATRAARRRWISFLVLLVVSVVLMGISSNPAVHDLENGVGFAFRPIQGALDEAARGVASVVAAVTDIDRLRTDNNALRSDNERLKVENARIGEIQRENQHLSALLGLRAGLDYQTVATTVIARESSEFRRLVVLDKGTDDGIALGDVVVAAGGGLAGRVVDVGPASAKVVLLTDSSSTVTGQLATNAATGEVVGQLGGVLLMRQVDAGETVSVGDEVVTAGIELGDGIRSPYPKGLLVGQVVDVKRDANAVVQTAYLEPAADLDTLEYLLVITDYQGGLPPIEQQPIDCGKGAVLPEGEQPCLSRSPAPTAAASPARSPAASAAATPRQ